MQWGSAPSGVKEQTSEPMMAGATLSGWPSIWVAMLTASARPTMRPVKAAAPMMPATVQVEEDPRPRDTGMLVSMSMAIGKGSSPQCSSARTNER